MKDQEIHSYTSNIAKLLKHLDTLQNIQNGKIVPIMVHSIPTHKCNLNCVHCCFKNREDRSASMPLDMWTTAMDQFHTLGTRALEYTGGGDPTLWKHINEATDYIKRKDFHVGIITNGLRISLIENWNNFDWVRVSLNTLDYKNDLNLELLFESTTVVSFCYIWNKYSDKNLSKIIDYCNDKKTVCRLAPDCITTADEIEKSLNHMRSVLAAFDNNKYVLLSDFNIETHRKNNDCRIHMIKPCLYLDGYVYACPSAELAVENERQVQDKVRICDYKNIITFYRNEATKTRSYECSYCKYVQQQELLENLLMDTNFNEFA